MKRIYHGNDDDLNVLNSLAYEDTGFETTPTSRAWSGFGLDLNQFMKKRREDDRGMLAIVTLIMIDEITYSEAIIVYKDDDHLVNYRLDMVI